MYCFLEMFGINCILGEIACLLLISSSFLLIMKMFSSLVFSFYDVF